MRPWVSTYPQITVQRLLLISRPALWINTIGVAVVGLWLSGYLWSNQLVWWLLLIWLTWPFNLLIYGLNDIADQAEDAHNPRKGGLQGARIQNQEVPIILWSTILLNVPMVLLLAIWAPQAILWILAYILLFVGYSLPPIRFKARPFWDSLSNVAYALPLAIVPACMHAPIPWWALLGLMSWSVAKHAFDAIQDISADRLAGVHTSATRLGIRGTVWWCVVWFGISTLLLGHLHFLVALGVIVVNGGLLWALWRQPSEQYAAKLYPWSILSPWLVGTIAGVLLVADWVRRHS